MDVTSTDIRERTGGVQQIATLSGPAAHFVGDDRLLTELAGGKALDQLALLTAYPGVESYVVGFSNLQENEGYPDGCALATATRDGPLIPAGIGPDINAGTRLLTSHLREEAVRPHLDRLMDELAHQVHVGDDRSGPLHLSTREVDDVLDEGCRFLVSEKRIGKQSDLDVLAHAGHFHGASASDVPAKAKQWAAKQLGTLGRSSGHFVEVAVVDRIYDAAGAQRLRLFEKQVVFQIHASARELGKQVWSTCQQVAREAMVRQGLRPPRPGMEWIPLSSKEGERCYQSLQAAANFGLSNRHVIAHLVRNALHLALRNGWDTSLQTLYDVSSNTVRLERWDSGLLCVHRRGATAAYEPGHREISTAYRDLGQPVLIPGSLATPSYVLLSAFPARDLAWASAPYGAGRTMSRHQARQRFDGAEIRAWIAEQGIALRLASDRTLAEEAPGAHRDAGACSVYLQRAGIANPVAQLRPIGLLKG